MDWIAKGSWFAFQQGQQLFLFLKHSDGVEAQLSFTEGARGSFFGLKAVGA
jgi:hypothetical protein